MSDQETECASPTGLQSPQDGQLLGLPEKLRQRLMPFQKEGVAFALSKNGRCMIADEMGLGKTVQAISVAYAYRQEWPLLVVVPSSLRYPWIEEMERWIPELNPGDINLVESKSDTTGIGRSKVTVLGYGLLTTDARSLVDALTRQRFAVVVVDESHYLKSRNAARSKILVPLIHSAKRAILLTGTPALGRPEELFMQIDALYPKRFGTWSDYAKQYCNAHYRFFGNRRQWDCRGASHLDELHQRLGQIMIRRLKEEVLTQLPPKVRQRIPFDLPKEAAKEASASFEEWETLMRTMSSRGAEPATADESPFTRVMGLVTRMYKQTAIAKAGAVKDYIRLLLETEGLKFLVFAHHLVMLQACTEAVIETKAGYIRIDGSVPSSERAQLVHKFQNDPDIRVAVLSIQAAGQGLTFTAASHVVFAELYWNPGHVKQAEDRAHRIGQTCSVHVHYLIAKGTFDGVMWNMLNRKETVTGSTLNGRKEYLKAEVGDKDKWDFLNFASAWTPSETLPAPGGEAGTGGADDSVFFSHFERDKQHDIRSFFSPGTAKKRKRTEVDEPPTPSSSSVAGSEGSPALGEEEEKEEEKEEEAQSQSQSPGPAPDDDFSPQVKRLRLPGPAPGPSPGPSPKSRFAGSKRRSLSGVRSGPSPRQPRPPPPRRLSAKPTPGGQWSCGACTYSNSTLLPYCEMCESPQARSVSVASPGPDRPSSIDAAPPCVVLSGSDSEPEPEPGPPAAPHRCPMPRTHTRKTEEEEEEEDGGPEGKQSPGEQLSPTPDDHSDAQTASDDPAISLPLYPKLMFCASRNTDRIYLYTEEGSPLNCNFVPLDITLDNWEDLPPAFRLRENQHQVLRFVREWSALTAMKQKLVRRSGRCFLSPLLVLDQLLSNSRRHSSTKRYLSVEDVAEASLSKAQRDGGSVRPVARGDFFARRRSSATATPAPPAATAAPERESEDGQPPPVVAAAVPEAAAVSERCYLQAVDSAGVPLCLSCQRPCPSTGGGGEDGAATAEGGGAGDAASRFCSQRCQEELALRSSQAYMRARVLEAEQGACQGCGLQAHQLYLRVRDAPPDRRKDILENTWLAQLPLKQLNEIIRRPVEGHFWQVDHIRPVYGGGGQCSLDNLQTLCTVCHRTRTAQQAKDRSRMKKGLAASKVASDITRFFIKK